MIRPLFGAALLAASTPALGMPDFVPKPSEVYEGYVALEMPRTEMPVGALWVQGYGPSGEGAAADNLVTERSLSQVTINSDLQLGLTAGILNLFGLDPSYRNKLSARFGDLSVVRVKDMSKLSGPGSEPRIYEAIRAGSVTITTDNEVGLDLDTRVVGQRLPVVGRADNGRRRSFSMDGKDMFIAFRVASQEEVKSDLRQVKLQKGADGWQGQIEGRRFTLRDEAGVCSFSGLNRPSAPASPAPASSASVATPEPGGQPASAGGAPGAPSASSSGQAEATLLLRVPVSDGRGGLFDRADLRIAKGRGEAKNPARRPLCGASAGTVEADVQLLGKRLQTFSGPKAPRW